ncbi:MAG: hypothetical protein ABS44_05105 [Chryseobacterium sp. SCN 40-13]|nr:MAG: hypothetical protein ABS44_05105 [Chryseobacterium sp. SCN 40-13]
MRKKKSRAERHYHRTKSPGNQKKEKEIVPSQNGRDGTKKAKYTTMEIMIIIGMVIFLFVILWFGIVFFSSSNTVKVHRH